MKEKKKEATRDRTSSVSSSECLIKRMIIQLTLPPSWNSALKGLIVRLITSLGIVCRRRGEMMSRTSQIA